MDCNPSCKQGESSILPRLIVRLTFCDYCNYLQRKLSNTENKKIPNLQKHYRVHTKKGKFKSKTKTKPEKKKKRRNRNKHQKYIQLTPRLINS